jgi:preprotein translocase subunit SecG
MFYSILQAIHIIVCIVLVVVVLMQSSKGGGLAGAFGGGGDQTVFGGRETATFLSKATTYLAVAFMVLSLSLAFLASKRGAGRPESAIRQAIEREGDVIPRGESIEDILGSSGLDSTAADTAK